VRNGGVRALLGGGCVGKVRRNPMVERTLPVGETTNKCPIVRSKSERGAQRKKKKVPRYGTLRKKSRGEPGDGFVGETIFGKKHANTGGRW